MIRTFFALAFMAAVLVATAAPVSAQAPEKVVFALNWFAVGDHAAYWVALEKGYYKAKGLDVELQNSKGSGDSIAKVDTGRADIGLADSAVVIAAVSRGGKIKVVGMVFDKTPLNIWSRKEAPITKPKDLEGKTIGAPPGDGQRQVFPAFAKLHGIDQAKVTWVNVEPAAKIPALAEKRVDSVADYTTGLPFYEKAMGKGNAVMMPWAEHGFEGPAQGAARLPRGLLHGLAGRHGGPQVGARDLQEARARDRPVHHRAQHEDGVRADEDGSLREERYRLDGGEEDVPVGGPGQHLHGRAGQGRVQGRLHQRVPDEDRAAEEHALGVAAAPAFIGLDRIGMTYEAASGPVEALRDISFAVERGELVALVGPSGCGKSTLLRIIAGLRPATAGSVFVAGRTVTRPIAAVGMVFQAPVLLRWRSILDNVLLPAELAGLDARQYRERAGQLLRLVGLAGFEDKLPRELSGGMQQRASLCRALLLDPPLLLMDEPFGALDAMTRDEMNLELLRVWGEGAARDRKTIVFVTHSIPEAVFLADRVVVMTPRPGRVARVCPVGLPRPRTVAARASADFGRLSLEIYEILTARPA